MMKLRVRMRVAPSNPILHIAAKPESWILLSERSRVVILLPEIYSNTAIAPLSLSSSPGSSKVLKFENFISLRKLVRLSTENLLPPKFRALSYVSFK